MEYSLASGKGDGVSGVLKFLGALARSKEPLSVSLPECVFGSCRTRSFLLDGHEMGGGYLLGSKCKFGSDKVRECILDWNNI